MKRISITRYSKMKEITKNSERCNDEELIDKELIELINQCDHNLRESKLVLEEWVKDLEKKASRIVINGLSNVSRNSELDIIRRYVLLKEIELTD